MEARYCKEPFPRVVFKVTYFWSVALRKEPQTEHWNGLCLLARDEDTRRLRDWVTFHLDLQDRTTVRR